MHAEPGEGLVVVEGRLDELLHEPATAAAAYVRSQVSELAPDLEPGWLARHDLRVGQPYGDVPADLTAQGAASAGLAIAAALASLVSGRLARTEVAVTGGLTADGELLPARAFREKAHCAKRGYAQFLVAPRGNEPDVPQVSQQDRRDLRLVFAATPADALRAALDKHPADGHSRVS